MNIRNILLIGLSLANVGLLFAQQKDKAPVIAPTDTIKPSKVLVAYYSRTGTTRQVAVELAAMLGADVEEITDTKDRKGFFGYMGAGKDTSRKKTTVIGPLQKDPAGYDLVVLATPV